MSLNVGLAFQKQTCVSLVLESPFTSTHFCPDCVIRCLTAVRSASTRPPSLSTSIRTSLSLTRVSTSSSGPSLQRAVSRSLL